MPSRKAKATSPANAAAPSRPLYRYERAAAELDCSIDKVRRLIAKGLLTVESDGFRKGVPVDDVIAYKAHLRQRFVTAE